MTVEQYNPSGGWGDLGEVGLEDVDASDIQMPRLQIDHATATFKDPASGVSIPSLTCVILGLVKQRIMWDTEVDDGDKPQCKSPDHVHGFPQLRTDIPARKQFPWSKSNFNPADHQPNPAGHIILPCASCVFTEWGADKSKPPCSEQYTYALYYRDEDGGMHPGIVSFQRSGMKAARTYTGTFATNKQPMFTVWSHISLRAESRGKVVYATPQFSRGENTAPEKWEEYAEGYRSVRNFLHEPPRIETDDDEDAPRSRPGPASAVAATKLDADDPWSAPAAPRTGPPAAPAAPGAPSVGVPAATAVIDDDDIPF